MSLPRILCSSVIRAAHRGDAHGGIYSVDMQTGDHDLLLSWDRGDIDWDGRGGDRGIRGMAFWHGELYAAAGDELFVFDKQMRILRGFRSPWLKHTHEVSLDRAGKLLYVIANMYDAILAFDLERQAWKACYILPPKGQEAIGARAQDPHAGQPQYTDHLHLDSVLCRAGKVCYSGHHMTSLNAFDPTTLAVEVVQANLPHTHNAQPYMGGVIYNVCIGGKTEHVSRDGAVIDTWATPRYPKESMTHTDMPQEHAVQAYTRGMVIYDPYVIVGSSPATVYAWTHGNPEPVRKIQLSNDVRNSICGMVRSEW